MSKTIGKTGATFSSANRWGLRGAREPENERIVMSEQQRRDAPVHTTPKEVFERMLEAANRHDLEAMVACFALDYQGELPFTPERNLTGQAGVRNNWSVFFGTMPDFRVEILSAAVEGDTVWAELFFHGTRADGTKQMMRGVNIAGVHGEQLAWSKLYQNSVQEPPAQSESRSRVG